MKKYLSFSFGQLGVTAGPKARIDADVILKSLGYSAIQIRCSSSNKIIRNLLMFIDSFRLIITLKKSDVLFLQMPIIRKNSILIYVIIWLIKPRIQLLIHDLDFLRGLEKTSIFYSYFLKHSELIIAHTERMKTYLIENGVSQDVICILNLFDYLTDNENSFPTTFGNNILFAGNLQKSQFLSQLNELSDLQFILYGNIGDFQVFENMIYKGVFSPEDIRNIEGDWGLVWDGDSIDTCSGLLGKYLSINSSYKASLYIACKKPIIAWKGSSLGQFIERNHLGICVESLKDISKRIDSLTLTEINRMKMSIKEFSDKLRNGNQLRDIMNNLNIIDQTKP